MRGSRYHLLSLTAAGLGVALGLGLGAGPVAEDSVASQNDRNARLAERVAELESRVDALHAAAAVDGRVVSELAAPLTSGRLAGRSVVVVATPDAPPDVVHRVRTSLRAAGATVTGVLTLTPAYVDPTQAQSPLEDLALRLVPPGVEFADDSSSIERVGAVLARATVTRPARSPDSAGDQATVDGAAAEDDPTGGTAAEPRPVQQRRIDRKAAEVIAGLEELDAIRLKGKAGRLAELAVMVAGRDGRAAAEPALAGLLAALDAGSLGAVLAAPGPAQTGALRWARDATANQLEQTVSTVDSLDQPIGPAALVLALAEQAAGRSGTYGTGRGARAVLPDP